MTQLGFVIILKTLNTPLYKNKKKKDQDIYFQFYL